MFVVQMMSAALEVSARVKWFQVFSSSRLAELTERERGRTRPLSSSLSQTAGHQSVTDGALSDHGSDQGISTPD